jgi:hypothetical protein
MKLLTILFALLCGALPAHAGTILLLGTGTGSSNQTPAGCTTNGSDGYAGAPAHGSYQHTDFFTAYAPQSGQAAYASTPGWCVPGVGYKTGYDTTATLKLPGVDTLPAGFSIASAGSFNYLNCSGANRTLTGWDLTQYVGIGGKIGLTVDCSSVTGTLTITNNKMACNTGTLADQYLIWVESGAATKDIEFNQFDGGTSVTGCVTTAAALIQDQGTGTRTFQYNDIRNCPSKCVLWSSPADVTMKFNSVEGMNYCNPGHGEIALSLFTGTRTNHTDAYNLFLEPATDGGGATAVWYPTGGSANGSVITNYTNDHNAEVANGSVITASIGPASSTLHVSAITCATTLGNGIHIYGTGVTSGTALTGAGPGGGTGDYPVNNSQTVASESMYFVAYSQGGVEFGYIDVTNPTITNNYMDASGALGCNVDAAGGGTRGSVVMSGNIDMITGNSMNAMGTCPTHAP